MPGPDYDFICQRLLPELHRFKLTIERGRSEVGPLLGKSHALGGRSLKRLEVTLRELRMLTDHEHLTRRRTLARPGSPAPGHDEATEAGEALLRFIEKVYDSFLTMQHELHGFQQSDAVTIASINSAWLVYGNELKTTFAKMAAGASLHQIYRRNTPAVFEAVERREALVGIISVDPHNKPVIPAPLAIRPWLTEEMVLVFSASQGSLPGRSAASTAEHLKHTGNRFITLHGEASLRPTIDRYFEKIRLKIPKSAEGSASIEEVKSAIKQHNHISILPKPCVAHDHDLRYYSLIPEGERRHLSVIYRANTMWLPVQTLVSKCFPAVAKARKAGK